MQALLPVFLEALHKTVPPAYNRLVVLSTDAGALSTCRRIHTYCLPWFDRRRASPPLPGILYTKLLVHMYPSRHASRSGGDERRWRLCSALHIPTML